MKQICLGSYKAWKCKQTNRFKDWQIDQICGVDVNSSMKHKALQMRWMKRQRRGIIYFNRCSAAG